MLLPILGLSQTSSEPTIVIRDTLPDGRVFYIDLVNDAELGELMRTDVIGMETIRNINNDRVAAQKENVQLKADIVDCESEKDLKDKEITSINIQKGEVEKQYAAEQAKNKNNSIVIKDYKKQASTGKIMTIVGGIGLGVGIGGILYAVIVTQIN